MTLVILLLFCAGVAAGYAQTPRIVTQQDVPFSDSMVFSADGKYFAGGNWAAGAVVVWETSSGRELRRFYAKSSGGQDGFLSLAFSPDGANLAVMSEILEIWNLRTGAKIKENGKICFSGEIAAIRIDYAADGKSLEIPCDGKMQVLNLQTDLVKIRPIVAAAQPFGAVYSYDRRFAAYTGDDGRISIETTAPKKKIYESAPVAGKLVAVAPDGRFYAVTPPTGEEDAAAAKNSVEFHDRTANGAVVSRIASAELLADQSFLTTHGFYTAETHDKDMTLRDEFGGKKYVFPKAFALTVAPTAKKAAIWQNGMLVIYDFAAEKVVRDFGEFNGNEERFSVRLDFSPGGRYVIKTEEKRLEIWDAESDAAAPIYEYSAFYEDDVPIAVFSPDDRMFFVNENNSLETIAPGGALYETATKKRLKYFKLGVDESDLVGAAAISPNGEIIAVAQRDAYSETNKTIKLWRRGGQIPLSLIGHKSQINAVAFTPKGDFVLTAGADATIRMWNAATGKQTKIFAGHIGAVNELSVAADGKRLMSSGADGTKRVWDIAAGAEIISLTEYPNGWIRTSPDGRFDATDGALGNLHYAVGLEVINLEQLKEMYYEPGLLPKKLGFDRTPLRPIVPLADLKLHPEVVEQRIEPGTKQLFLKIRNRGGGIGRVQIFVGSDLGGKLAVEDARDERLKQNPTIAEASLTVDLSGANFISGKENKITVVTSNFLAAIGKGNLQSRGTDLVLLDGDAPADERLPALYAVVAGVSDYDGDALDLRFAAKDAEDFSNALTLGAQKLFCDAAKPQCLDKVSVKTLSTDRRTAAEQPTKENLRQAFADIAARAQPEDIVVIYLAGHGVTFGAGTDTYFYLTKEARSASRETLAQTYQTIAVSSAELTDWLTTKQWIANQKGIKPLKQVLILDTCASGAAAEKLTLSAKRDLSADQIRAIEFLKDKTGTFVLMGSTADAPSYEASQFGQGLLTYALLRAMKGAALDRGEFIDVQTLFGYAQTEVPRLAANIGGVQRPIVSAPLGKTFVIGQMTDAEKRQVALAPVKPIMLRPLLTNPETGDDDLRLIGELGKKLDAESSYEVMRRSGRGEPVIVYIDDENFPGAVRVTGTYTVEGGAVRLRAFLRRDGKTIATLPEIFSAKETAIESLLASIRAEMAKISD